ncbi:ABC transporter substrate-binding protein [Glaciibacter psychrotolerans]|uniref:Multiple sugar transport system substrate-binding protein n=1 Tax=Glaciibacter psychrotolerans TaxID=670054 RepID=A0A7Z0J7H8_9MICO|nr:extracellular solute-binding protein [Leifsonia psychrotolerans]NYJ21637.1 multiple sugar transport system substrate-binding protein [Leifsonia psychrotolerans]
MTHSTRFVRSAAVAAVAAISVFGLAGCNAAASSDAATDSNPITISYLHRLPDGKGMTPVNEIVKRWNAENPSIQVKATKFDGAATDMILKLETDVKAGKADCLAQLSYAEVPQMFVKGLLEDVADEAAKYSSDFSSGAYAMMSVGDAVVGLPQDTGPLVYYYNATEFEKLGLPVPTTIDELSSDAATAAATGKYVTAFTPDEALSWLSAQSAAAGDSWFGATDAGWTVKAEGAGSAKVSAFWQNLVDTKQTLVTERWGEAFTQALDNGSLIGHVGAAWEAGFLLDSLDGTPAEGQWRVAQLPDFGAGAMTGPDGGSGVAVMKGCAHPAEAMEFTGWFNTQIDDLASQGLVVAANGTPATSEKMLRQFGGQDVLAELATASSHLNPDFVYAPGFASLTKMNETAAGVADGSARVADIFTTAQTTAVATLKDFGLPVAP